MDVGRSPKTDRGNWFPLWRTGLLFLFLGLSLGTHYGTLLAAPPEEISDAEREQLAAERNRLWDEARAHAGMNEYKEAIAAAEKMLAIERRLLGDVHNAVANSLEFIAVQHQYLEEFDAALEAREEALQIRTTFFGKDDWRVTNARLAVENTRLLRGLSPEESAEALRASRIHAQAFADYERGNYRQAIGAAAEAFEIRKRILGEGHPFTAVSLNNLALLYNEMGEYAKAEPRYVQALEARRKSLGEMHPDTALSLNNLAALYAAQSFYAKAEPLYVQALEIRRKTLGEAHSDTAMSLNNLASLYQSQGDYIKAEPLYVQALETTKKALGVAHPDTATGLNNLAKLYNDMGYPAKAEPLYVQALEINLKVRGEAHPSTALSLNNLAALYADLGDYARAEPLLAQALKIRRDALGEEHPDTAVSLNNLAGLYKQQADYAKAEPLLVQALEITRKALGEAHPETATSLNNLASLYDDMGDYAKAEPLHVQALDIRRTVLGEAHPFTATSFNNLAAVYQNQGNSAKAEPLYAQALEINRKALGEEHPDTATSLNNLASLYKSRGDYAKAAPLYVQALEINRKVRGEAHPVTATSLTNLALLYRSQGDDAKAEPLLLKSLGIERELLKLTAAVQSERRQLVMAASMRNTLDSYLSVALGADVPPETVYAHVVAWKGQVFLRQQTARLARSEPTLRPLLEELEAITTRLATVALATSSPEQQEARQRQLRELSDQKERLEEDLSRNSSAFREAQQPVGVVELQATLPQKTALVDLLEYRHCSLPEEGKGDLDWERRLVAFIVRAQGPVVRVELGPVAPIAAAVDAWRETFGRFDEGTQASRDIRQRVWEPIEEHLGEADCVLISPDGALGRFPLAALPGTQPETYLLEERTIAIVPVPQALPELLNRKRQEREQGNLLALGGVDYDADPAKLAQESSQERKAFGRRSVRWEGGDKFKPLDGTSGELLKIKDLYTKQWGSDGLTTFEGMQASEEAVRQAISKHLYLHFATHGYFAPPELKSALSGSTSEPGPEIQQVSDERSFEISAFHPGLLSGLALAGANHPKTDGNDGILSAEEVASLDLSGVDVAVLSACETGLGKVAGGEGLLGLQRAFQVAGARTVVSTLWKVDDGATRDLMERFYTNMWERDMGTLAALREAQLWILRERGPRGLDLKNDQPPQRLPPQYWAAFQLSGDWR